MESKKAVIYLCLGANVGDRRANMKKALELLETASIKVIKKSGIYETEPVEVSNQPWFYNQVVKAETELQPEDLLLALKEIEREVGRKYTYRWGPRVIDIDILLYQDRIIDNCVLTIPHKLMDQRRFVLLPLKEIDPAAVHPVLKKTVEELLNGCKDTAIVRPL